MIIAWVYYISNLGIFVFIIFCYQDLLKMIEMFAYDIFREIDAQGQSLVSQILDNFILIAVPEMHDFNDNIVRIQLLNLAC